MERWFKKMFYPIRARGRCAGQAALELAIFGTIAFLILSSMINYAQTIAMQQEVGMYAFRRTLQLAKERGTTGASRQVDLTVFKEVYPASLFESGAERQKVSGSASIDWEYDSVTLDRDAPDTYPVHYWQLGRRMIARRELIELPTMHVQVINDSDREPRSFFKNMWLSFSTGSGGGLSDAWQSAPIDQTLTDNLKSTTSLDVTQEAGRSLTNQQNVLASEDNQMTMTMQPDAKILAWSLGYKGYKISRIYSKPANIAIAEQENINKNKAWQTPLR